MQLAGAQVPVWHSSPPLQAPAAQVHPAVPGTQGLQVPPAQSRPPSQVPPERQAQDARPATQVRHVPPTQVSPPSQLPSTLQVQADCPAVHDAGALLFLVQPAAARTARARSAPRAHRERRLQAREVGVVDIEAHVRE